MENRRRRLHQLLNRIKVAQQTTIEELAADFEVSTATIRRDIKELERDGLVIQAVGGTVVYQLERTGAVDPRRVSQAIEEKIRIAEYCTELVNDQDDILIGPGTTTFLAGKIMSGITDRSFRIITNSLELALETSAVPNIRTVIVGGEVWGKYSIGVPARGDYFAGCHRNHTLILSADGVDFEAGITVFESRLVEIVRTMIDVSSRIILAADSGKFGKTRYHHIAPISVVTTVITDTGAAPGVVDELRRRGVDVVTV